MSVRNTSISFHYRRVQAETDLNNRRLNGESNSTLMVQVQFWDAKKNKSVLCFAVGHVQMMADRLIGDFDYNILKTIPPDTPTILTLDIECIGDTILFIQGVSVLIDALIDFSRYIFKDTEIVLPTRDDFVVEEACAAQFRKCSAHLFCTRLIFADFKHHQFSFVFYFLSWLLENRQKYRGIPDFMLMPMDDENEPNIMVDQVALQVQQARVLPWTQTCVDTKIYSLWRVFRVCGVSKPVDPKAKIQQEQTPNVYVKNGAQRLLRPCKITKWWDNNCPALYVSDEAIRSAGIEARRAWFKCSILLNGQSSEAIKMPWPKYRPHTIDTAGIIECGASAFVCVDLLEKYEWMRQERRGIKRPRSVLSAQIPSQKRQSPLAYKTVLHNTAVNSYVEFYKTGTGWELMTYTCNPDGTWYHEESNQVVTKENGDYIISQLQKRSRIFKNLQLYELEFLIDQLMTVRELHGQINDLSTAPYSLQYGTKDWHIMNELKSKFNAAVEQIVGIMNSDRTVLNSIEDTDAMFTGNYVSPDFPVIIAETMHVVPLHVISSKISIFCPKHEGDGGHHSPSAFVDVTESGRHIIYCSVCSPTGSSMMEDVDAIDPEDLKGLTSNVVEVDKDFLDHHDFKPVCERKDMKFPYTVIVKSSTGTGKTSSLSQFLKALDGLNHYLPPRTIHGPLAPGQTRMDFIVTPSILAIAPRTLISFFTAKQLNLDDYKQVQANVEQSLRQSGQDRDMDVEKCTKLCETNQLAICLNSLLKLSGRKRDYEAVLVDELRLSAESLIGELCLPNLRSIIEVYEDIMRKSQFRIVTGADMDIHSLRVMLPDVDFNDPTQCTIRVNTGGKGGIYGHEVYQSDDLVDTIRILLGLIADNNKVFVPTNQVQMVLTLDKIIRTYFNGSKKVVTVEQGTSYEKKKMLAEHPDVVLRDCDVFIASPTFGTGFSVNQGIFDECVGFFFTYPETVTSNLQHLARIRGYNNERIIIYYQRIKTPAPKDFVLSETGRNRSGYRGPSEYAKTFAKALKTYQLTCVDMLGDFFGVLSPLANTWQWFKAVKDSEAMIESRFGAQTFFRKVSEVTKRQVNWVTSLMDVEKAQLTIEVQTLIDAFKNVKKRRADDNAEMKTFDCAMIKEIHQKQLRGQDVSVSELKALEIATKLNMNLTKLREHEINAAKSDGIRYMALFMQALADPDIMLTETAKGDATSYYDSNSAFSSMDYCWLRAALFMHDALGTCMNGNPEQHVWFYLMNNTLDEPDRSALSIGWNAKELKSLAGEWWTTDEAKRIKAYPTVPKLYGKVFDFISLLSKPDRDAKELYFKYVGAIRTFFKNLCVETVKIHLANKQSMDAVLRDNVNPEALVITVKGAARAFKIGGTWLHINVSAEAVQKIARRLNDQIKFLPSNEFVNDYRFVNESD